MSLPRRLKSQATSSSRDTTKPAQCFLSSSLRSSESFVLVSFPANLTGNSLTGSHGRGGRSPPQTLSTRFSDTATRSDPPLFLIFSASFLAMELESKVGSTPTTFPPADSSADRSCQVGTSWMPCFRSSQFLSSCRAAWLKYRPSVAMAAFSCVMTALPTEPLKPQMNSRLPSQATTYSDEWLSSDSTTKRRDPSANLAQTSAASDCRVLSYYTYRSCALS